MATVEMPIRLKGQTTCGHHNGRELKFYCEQCLEPVCSNCVKYIHKGHYYCYLSEITTPKKDHIKHFLDRAAQTEPAEIEHYIASANILLKENDIAFEKLSKQLTTQNDRLKTDLDNLTAETLLLYQKMKEDNNKLINKYTHDLEMYHEQLKQQMQECKKVLQQGSPIEIYNTEYEVDFRVHIPVKPMLGSISFTPNTYPRNHLELALGIYKFDYTGKPSTLRVKDGSASLSQGHGQSPTKEQSSGDKGKKAVTRTKLLTEARVVDEWKSPCHIDSISPATADLAWTRYFNERLILQDRKGRVLQKVTHKVMIRGISISPTTHRLWACDMENYILELILGKLLERFRTKDTPRSICVTSDNHIIIGMSKNISKYTTQGQIVLTSPYVCSPDMIKECPITNNIAVIDQGYRNDGGDGFKYVLVMDAAFRELSLYICDIPSRYKETPPTGDKPFNPNDIVYDNQGNIIISDWVNEKIHILNGDGGLLRITDTAFVRALGVDRQDVLWAVNIKNVVKLLQYSEPI